MFQAKSLDDPKSVKMHDSAIAGAKREEAKENQLPAIVFKVLYANLEGYALFPRGLKERDNLGQLVGLGIELFGAGCDFLGCGGILLCNGR